MKWSTIEQQSAVDTLDRFTCMRNDPLHQQRVIVLEADDVAVLKRVRWIIP